MSVVITSCTNRKTAVPAADLRAANLPLGDVQEVAGIWRRRLQTRRGSVRARQLYAGRSFREAEAAAAEASASLLVLSAGAGLIEADRLLPAYSLSVAEGSPDNILSRLSDTNDPAEWWRGGIRATGLGFSLREAAERAEGLVLVACGRAYLRMIAPEFAELPPAARSRFRIFTASPEGTVPPEMRAAWMPYDSRLDGSASPRPGTLSDFAQRALRDFVEAILPLAPHEDVAGHRECVTGRLSGWPQPARSRGATASDVELVAAMQEDWAGAGGSSGRMLRLLRGRGLACEQRRFRRLFAVASEGVR